jgi:hypothetical protein
MLAPSRPGIPTSWKGQQRGTNDPMRWGLRQIAPLPRIRLFDCKELLRQIQEAGFPDQTGVEEIEDHSILTAQESMMRWLIDPGEWDGRI